jgi:DNA replication protein DnaC
VGKPSARRAWRTARKTASVDQLTDALKAWEQAWRAQRRASDRIPHASTWLNDRRWEDPPDTPRPVVIEPKGFAGIRAAAGLGPA